MCKFIIRIISFFIITYSSFLPGQSLKISTLYSNNDTEAIIEAMHSNYDTIILDYKSTPWIISPLRFHNIANKVILIDKGVEIKAKEKAFPNHSDALMRFTNCKDISIIGEGSVLSMNKNEYVSGEWRHGINIRGSENFIIKNITIKNTGGDGIYIAGTKNKKYSENILIENVKCINNRRQGLSIISGRNIKVLKSEFSQTKGTLPGAGLDIEPNTSTDIIEHILVKDCIFEDNFGAGVVVGLRKLDNTSQKISIHFENCILRNNHAIENTKVAAEIIVGANAKNPVKGNLVFNKLFVENSNWGILYTRKRSEAFTVTFKDCALKNTNKKEKYPIIYFEVPNYYKPMGDIGGISFENIYIDNTTEADLVLVRGSKLGTLRGFSGISGTFFYKSGLTTKPIRYINYDHKNNKNVDIKYVKIDD